MSDRPAVRRTGDTLVVSKPPFLLVLNPYMGGTLITIKRLIKADPPEWSGGMTIKLDRHEFHDFVMIADDLYIEYI